MDFLFHQECLLDTLVEEYEEYRGRLARKPLEQGLELGKYLHYLSLCQSYLKIAHLFDLAEWLPEYLMSVYDRQLLIKQHL